MYVEHSKIKVVGIDLAENGDFTVLTEGYYKDGVITITKIEVIEGDE